MTITDEEEQEVLSTVRQWLEEVYDPAFVTSEVVDCGLMSLVDDSFVIVEILDENGVIVGLTEARV